MFLEKSDQVKYIILLIYCCIWYFIINHLHLCLSERLAHGFVMYLSSLLLSKLCFFRAVQQLNYTKFKFLKYLIKFFEKTNKAQSHFVKNLIKFSPLLFIDINLFKLPGFYLVKFSYLYILRKRSILNFYLWESVHIF